MQPIVGTMYDDNGAFYPTLVGTAGNDSIYGLAGNDIIYGLAGSDYIDGGTGADQMYGGLHGDNYIVDNPNDKVFENANEGTDGVRSFVTYTMPNNVESLYLQGTGNINGFGNNLDKTSLIGNSGNNYLRGGDGRNVLNGQGGADTLEGVGVSDDAYVVDSPGDRIVDGQATGTETVLSSVSWDLRVSYRRVNPNDNNDLRVVQNDPGVEGLDHLSLLGSGHINGIGNKLANTMKGNNGNNTLEGLGGSDQLLGFSGSDTLIGYGGTLNERDVLTGGSDADLFVLGNAAHSSYIGDGDNGYAIITDFLYDQGDKIQMKGLLNDYQWKEGFHLGAGPTTGTGAVMDALIYSKGGDLIAVVQDQNRSNGGFWPEVDVNFV